MSHATSVSERTQQVRRPRGRRKLDIFEKHPVSQIQGVGDTAVVGVSGRGLVGDAPREGSHLWFCRDFDYFPKCHWGAVGSFEQQSLIIF